MNYSIPGKRPASRCSCSRDLDGRLLQKEIPCLKQRYRGCLQFYYLNQFYPPVTGPAIFVFIAGDRGKRAYTMR